MKNNIICWISEVIGKHKIKIILLSLIQAALGGSGVFYAVLLRNIIDNADKKIKAVSCYFLSESFHSQLCKYYCVRQSEDWKNCHAPKLKIF